MYSTTFGQSILEKGYYNIQSYPSQEYKAGPQNWDIIQDERGVMYVANNDGVLEFDGEHWRLIPIGEESRVTSLALTDHGIYVGAQNELGHLVVDDNGSMAFRSLLPEMTDSIPDFGTIWQIHESDNAVYFIAESTIFRWENEEFESWNVEGEIRSSVIMDGVMYFSIKNNGIRKLNDGSISMVDGASALENAFVSAMMIKDDDLLLFVVEQGLMRMRQTGGDMPGDVVIEPFRTTFDGFLYEHDVTAMEDLGNGYMALKLIGSGLMVMDDQGIETYRINEEYGLPGESVYSMFVDRDGNLWLTMSNGLARVDISSQVTSFAGSGLKGTVESICRSGDELYVATGGGVYYLNHSGASENGVFDLLNAFQKVEGINEQTWALGSYVIGSDTLVLVAGNNSVFQIKEGVAEIVKSAYPWTMHQSQVDPNRIYICLEGGLESIYWNGTGFDDEGLIDGISGVLMDVTQDDQGWIWIGLRHGEGLIQLKDGSNATDPDRVEWVAHPGDNGIFDGVCRVRFVNGELLVGSDAGIFRYDYTSGEFSEHPDYAELVGAKGIGVHRLSVSPGNELWMTGFEIGGNGKTIGIFRDGGLLTFPFDRISTESTHALWHEPNDITWLGGPHGLFRYDEGIEKDYSRAPNVLIRRVVMNSDSTLYHGGSRSGQQLKEQVLEYKNNNIYFEYAAPVYESQEAVLYSSMLVGYDNDWSSWKNTTERNFTNLGEGDYEFKVKCMNVYGVVSSETIYTFQILPPWYRTAWAYVLYILLFGGFVYVAIRLSVARVKRQNERLEEIIEERTREIVKQKEEIEEQKEMVEEKNQEIMDSIVYAQRLQEAILPPSKLVEEWLPDSYVLFKPKDIVSGDFYWMEQVEEDGVTRIYFAAVDCTGHGVPGAMVSVVGHNGLERCLKEFSLRKPAEILDKLTELVEETFEKSESEVKDGMDIALCCLTRSDNGKATLEYAGANNPLYIIAESVDLPDGVEARVTELDGEPVRLHELKADKQPIGKYIDRKPFAQTTIEVNKGDSIVVFSDGYADQFGGIKGKKFKYGTFKKLLIELNSMMMKDQAAALDKAFEEWRGDLEQVDDVCVIGVRI